MRWASTPRARCRPGATRSRPRAGYPGSTTWSSSSVRRPQTSAAAPHATWPQPGARAGAAVLAAACAVTRPTWRSTRYDQRLVVHQPVLEDAARVQVGLLSSPAVVLMDTGLLPAAFKKRGGRAR